MAVAIVLAAQLAGCGGADGSGGSSTAAVGSSTTAIATSVPSKLVVTVPSLSASDGGSVPVSSPEASSVAAETAATISETSISDGPPASESAAPAETSAPATVDVTLANCEECTVIGTAAGVAGGLSVALISQNGRAVLLSLDGSGAVRGASNVPYGSTFPSPPDGRLGCGGDARCVVVGAQPDGHAVLSAFQLNGDGSWTDLSGSGGFVSATGDGVAVPLEGGYAAAIKVSDGATTVWTVIAWNGSAFAVVGCTPDGATPDLSALDLGVCLS